jgi:hypothetical protein
VAVVAKGTKQSVKGRERFNEKHMTDVVYTLGKGSRLKDFEIRMSLRSIERHLKGILCVYVIGEKPDWLQNVVHMQYDDESSVPDYNIMRKVTAACDLPEITDSFLFMNDDHFLLQDFEAETFPYYYMGTLEQAFKGRNDGYGKRANNSLKHLQENNLPTKHFDIHTPILYNKQEFKKNVSSLDWKEGYIIKSLYANSLKIEGVEMKDNKINHPPQANDKIFSTFPHLKASVTRFLTETFPEQSRFERIGL